MGKVVRAIAIVGLVAATAYFAPYLSGTVLALTGTAATIATAVIATTISLAGNALFSVIGYSPADAPSGYRRGHKEVSADGLRLVDVEPTPPVAEPLAPINEHWLRDRLFFPWQRHAVIRMSGDCMAGVVAGEDRWAVLDRSAPIEPGDLFAFDLDDLWTAYAPDQPTPKWRRPFVLGMVKRYLGTEPEWGRVIFDCTNPPSLCETGRNHLRFACRVTASFPTWIGAMRALWAARSKC